MRPLAILLLLPIVLVLLPGRGAAADEGEPPLLPRLVGGGGGWEKVTYGNGSGAVDVTRYLLFGEMEIPRASLLGDDRFTLRLGVHSYELENLSSTDPAVMAGIFWRGGFAPASGEEGRGKWSFPKWHIDGRVGAQLFDAPEGPAGTAIDLSGEVLLHRRQGESSRPYDFYVGPSFRYGILPMDRVTLDNGVPSTSTHNVTSNSFLNMVGIVAGAEIPVGKRFLLRPEARLGADVSACLSLLYLPAGGEAKAPTPPPPAAPAPAESDLGLEDLVPRGAGTAPPPVAAPAETDLGLEGLVPRGGGTSPAGGASKNPGAADEPSPAGTKK
jgi:hypothetical protein